MELPVPPPVAPMLAKLSRELPEGEWCYEPKWDQSSCMQSHMLSGSSHDIWF